MSRYQVELIADKGSQTVYTCVTFEASNRLAAMHKAKRESKKSGSINQRMIRAREVSADTQEIRPF